MKHCFFRSAARLASVLILFAAACRSAPVQARDTENFRTVLVINSYQEAWPWSNSLITMLSEYGAATGGTDVFAEHLNTLLIDDEQQAGAFMQTLHSTYESRRPDVVVILGNPAFALLHERIRESWGDVPILLCADEAFIGPQEAYLQPRPIFPPERVPLESLTEKSNMTYLLAPFYLDRSVELMRRMLPGMRRLIFIGDERQINRQVDHELGTLVRENHPDLDYVSYSAGEITIDELFDKLHTVDPQHDGILFSSWFSRRQVAGNAALMTGSYRVIAGLSLPIFVANYVGLEDTGFVGGYVYDRDAYEARLLAILDEVLVNGDQPRSIPAYIPQHAVPVFNYPDMLLKELDPRRVPAGSVYLDRPESLWDRYKWIVLLCVVAIGGFILLQQWRISVLRKMRKAREQEAETAAKYSSLFDNMPILYMQEQVVCDEHGKAVETVYLDVNSYFERKFMPRSEAVGRRGSELFPESMSEFLPVISLVLAEKRVIAFPYFFHKVNSSYDVIISCSYLPGVVDIFCLDSTELYKAQQTLRDINYKLTMALEVANIVPWKWDLTQGTILCDVARSARQSEDDGNGDQFSVPDMRYFSKIHKEDRERVRTAYNDLIEGRSEKVHVEYRVITRDMLGHRMDWVEARAAVGARDEQGRPTMLIGSSLVITQRKELEQDLRTARDRAEESNRLKSAFLANMSHEIRTPLNAIVGFSGILASTDEATEREQYVQIIENNNELLLQLISDILDLSKIESGMLEFVDTDFELCAFLDEKVSMTRQRVADGVEVCFDPPQSVCWIRTDKNRLAQLLINLLTNAAKFTPAGGSIRLDYALQDGTIRFSVTDTGCGIPTEMQDAIFERFVKLNEFKQGTGLGLSICRTIVQHMNGQIGVESEPGKGSTFWFVLPFTPGENRVANEREHEKPVVERDKLTILVAEDNESNYCLFESILKNDYRLLHAWNGQQAVELFEKYRPHLVLMDINMPVMNGYEATRGIRNLSPDVPVIAVTAFAFASDEKRVMESGFTGYVSKPIQARRLKAQIQDILRTQIVMI